jgi:uncharacterized protein YxjI
MHEKLFALGSNFWIENADGEQVYQVKNEFFDLRNTLIFADAQGSAQCKVQQKLLAAPPEMEIFDADGALLAAVQKAWLSFPHERYSVKLATGEEYEVKGDFTAHEYTVTAGQAPVAQISRRWFRPTDTFGVQVEPGQNDVLILAATVAIDQLSAPQK